MPHESWLPQSTAVTDSGMAVNLSTLHLSLSEDTRLGKNSFGLKFFLKNLEARCECFDFAQVDWIVKTAIS
jgi:hypothetical protein